MSVFGIGELGVLGMGKRNGNGQRLHDATPEWCWEWLGGTETGAVWVWRKCGWYGDNSLSLRVTAMVNGGS